MEAEDFEMDWTEDLFHSLGFSHPLVLLMPYDTSAPAPLLAVQDLLWAACDSQRSYTERLKSALSIRVAVGQLGLGSQEAAMVSIDLLQGLQKLLLSAALLEQLAWAFLDRDGIGLQDRRFSSPPNHPLPTLVRIDREPGKPVPVTHAREITDALSVWTSVSMEQSAKSPNALEGTCCPDLRASLRMLILFLMHGDLDQFRATRGGNLDRFEDMGLSLWDILLTLLRKCPEYCQKDEERFSLYHRPLDKSARVSAAKRAAKKTTAPAKKSAAKTSRS
jgi:hypothetical protein